MRILVISVLLFLVACKGTPVKTEAGVTKKDSIPVKEYYPIAAFIAEELKYIDENPAGIMRYITYGQHTDSGFVSQDTLKAFAEAFSAYDLNAPSLRKKVVENGFKDNTLDRITLSYTINDTSYPLKRADVLVKEGQVRNVVSSIYLETTDEKAGYPISRKLYWKAHKNCMIIEEWTDKTGKAQFRQTKMVWDKEEG